MRALAWGRGGAKTGGGLAACLIVAALAGCSQTASNSAPAPAPLAKDEFVAPGDPIVLTGGAPVEAPKVSKPKDPAGAQAAAPKDKAPAPTPATPSKADATRDVAAPEPPPAPVEALPESPPLAAEPAATAEVAKPEPAKTPPPDPAPAPAAETEAPAPVSTAAAPASSYPNINAAPAEPAGKLLSPDERKKLIMKLNSLARRQGGNTSNSGQPCPEGASEADCKAAIE
jgi:hypothetical protein